VYPVLGYGVTQSSMVDFILHLLVYSAVFSQ
jgi:hypothetical protein